MSKKDKARARERTAALNSRLQWMTGLAALATLTNVGLIILARLPHGFASVAAGQGKKPIDNMRVRVLLGVLAYLLIINKNLAVRLWAIPVVALLGLAIAQHKATYENNGDPSLKEVY